MESVVADEITPAHPMAYWKYGQKPMIDKNRELRDTFDRPYIIVEVNDRYTRDHPEALRHFVLHKWNATNPWQRKPYYDQVYPTPASGRSIFGRPRNNLRIFHILTSFKTQERAVEALLVRHPEVLGHGL